MPKAYHSLFKMATVFIETLLPAAPTRAGSNFILPSTIVDPLAAVPSFLAMTPNDTVEQRLRTARVA
jgi:hypothetical protein